MGKINVKGVGVQEFAADIMELVFEIGTESASPVSAAEKGKAQTEALLGVLTELGLPLGEITMKQENVREQRGFNGQPSSYRFHKELTLKTKADLSLLEAISGTIVAKEIPAAYSQSFSLSDEKKCSGLVIKQALADAREKAELIASASGNRITCLDHADFEYAEEAAELIRCAVPLAASDTAGTNSLSAQLSPDKITIRKEINTCWNME